MAEVVRALNVLARHGSQAQSPVLVGADHAQLVKTSFIASKQNLVLQKQELKQLSDFFKQLRKQKKGFNKNSLKKSHRRQCGEFDSKNERFDFQDKVKKHRKDKSCVEKAQRKEEKAAKQLEKAQKYALKAKQEDFSSHHAEKFKKREEKAERKAAKYEKAARKADDPEKAARKAEKCEGKAARKVEKYEGKAARKAEKEKRRQHEGYGTQVPCVGQQGQY